MAETDCCILNLMQQLGKLKENHEIVNQYEPDDTILTIQTYKQQLLSIFCVPVCQEFLNMKFTLKYGISELLRHDKIPETSIFSYTSD